MKKIFTLIALATLAISVNAQGKFALAEGDEYGWGDQPKRDARVTNCEMTFGDAADTEGTAAFKAAAADTHVDGYEAYTAGNGVNGNKPGGTYYVFKPAVAGSITVAIVLNADKKFHISEDGTDLDAFNGITVSEKYYGTYSFNVKAGSVYKVWCDGSKLGFYGFEFSDQPAVDAISNVVADKADGVAYNLAGQKVDAAFKGIVIKNGKKMIQK